MGFSTGFAYDLFISYAHVDNAATTGPGWVDSFVARLTNELDRLIGRGGSVSVWFDGRNLSSGSLVDPTIETALQHSALFLGLLSTGFLASPHCPREWELFGQWSGQEGQPKLENKSRMVPVMLANLPPSRWPEGCNSVLFPRFYQLNTDEDVGSLLESGGADLNRQCSQLAEDLFKMLTQLNKVTLALAGTAATPGRETSVQTIVPALGEPLKAYFSQ